MKNDIGLHDCTDRQISSVKPCVLFFIQKLPRILAEFKSFVIDTKSNTKSITKSISIHSDYLGVHFLVSVFVLLIHQYGIFGREICHELQKPTRMLLILSGIAFCK